MSCPVPDCNEAGCRAHLMFCDKHWKAMGGPSRKFLKSEFAHGEKARWPNWVREHYDRNRDLIAARVKFKEERGE